MSRKQLQQKLQGAQTHRPPTACKWTATASKNPNSRAIRAQLALWFRQQEARDQPITDESLGGQAKLFGPQFNVPESFAYSDGWHGKFKKRQGIKQIVKHGEANDADSHGVELARKAIPKIVNDGSYAAQDIYNQDETG
jgi:hypothetical protein